MKTITAAAVRAQLTDLIRNLDAGPITITKHGKPIAVLTSPQSAVTAMVEPSPATDASEQAAATTTAREAEKTLHDIAVWAKENNVIVKDLETQARIDSFSEETDELDVFEQKIEELDDDFETYLSSDARQKSAPEAEASLDEFAQRVEDFDDDFETYLSNIMPEEEVSF
tara:strand:+ start:1537 stop:2046 length:510 start_codon:yes stop_codon:yes gene_type:complete